MSSPDVEARVDTALGGIGASDLDEEHGLLESGRGEELSGVAYSAGSGDDLTTTSVDSIGVELTSAHVET